MPSMSFYLRRSVVGNCRPSVLSGFLKEEESIRDPQRGSKTKPPKATIWMIWRLNDRAGATGSRPCWQFGPSLSPPFFLFWREKINVPGPLWYRRPLPFESRRIVRARWSKAPFRRHQMLKLDGDTGHSFWIRTGNGIIQGAFLKIFV